MAESVYKVIELVGSSTESWDKAATAAVAQAGKSLRDLRIAEVSQLDLQLDENGEVRAYRAKTKVSVQVRGRVGRAARSGAGGGHDHQVVDRGLARQGEQVTNLVRHQFR